MKLEIGDKLSVPGRAGTRHVGVYAGGGAVIHNSKQHLRVVEEPLAAFASGERVTVEARARRGMGGVVVDRAREHLGTSYDLLRWNCEHLAEYARTGTASSPQLKGALGFLALAALTVGVAYDQRGYDGKVGRHRDGRGRFRATSL